MITITELAAGKVKEIADAEGLHGQGLRLRVLGGGCAGFQYDLYFEDAPTDMDERDVIAVDPMLATGHSAVAAIDKLKSQNPRSIKFLCLLAAPAGIQTLHEAHPDVPIYTAAIDRELNDHGYILPGLGDAGDRIFGTK